MSDTDALLEAKALKVRFEDFAEDFNRRIDKLIDELTESDFLF